MRITLNRFESGWVGISIALTDENLDLFVQKLQALKAGSIGHFHLRANDFDGQPNVGDVEISLASESDGAFSIE
ncbi:MAG: hypothetical protein IT472_03375 [Thermomonas sp.]|uniref:hypothetical protein n=1 Tax=Thermomonas sp. TaxID=1971895 RepID=UPI00261C2E98|nr:hypothetical protein [Thermomonas sp.]MCC7096204.1 hypothetical protein [Thermomonas sp.]